MKNPMLHHALFRPLVALVPATFAAVIVDITMAHSFSWDAVEQLPRLGGLAMLVEATLLTPMAILLAGSWIGAKTLVEISDAQSRPSGFAGLLLGLVIGGFTTGVLYLMLFRAYFEGLDISFLEKKELAGQVISVASWLQLCVAGGVGLVVAGAIGRTIARCSDDVGRYILMAVRWVALGLALGTLLAGFALHRNVDNLRVVLQAPLITLALLIAFAAAYSFSGHWNFVKTLGPPVTLSFVLALGGVGSSALISEHSRGELESNLVLPRILLAQARAVLDFDDDGFSAVLGGGDCDDQDPAVFPGARDVPGNGLDEDCADGDAIPIAIVEERVALPQPEKKNTAKEAAVGQDQTPPPSKPQQMPPETLPPPPGEQPEKVAELATPPNRDLKNLVIILIDALRADRISALGYPRKTTANLDALAQRGRIFSRAYAQSNHTPRSVPSIFSGQYPSQIPWKNPDTNYPAIADSALLLAELFRDHGFDTAAITEHHYFKAERNIRQGFRLWNNGDGDFQSIKTSNKMATAPSITNRSKAQLDILAKSSMPFVLFVHYSDPHSEYIRHPKPWKFGRTLQDRYDGEIAFCDHHFGMLIQHIDQLGLNENTAIIVLSDHGEAFGEHRFHFHGHTLFEEEIRVPLIISGPGILPGTTTNAVNLVDILPTAAALFNLTHALPEDLPGRSLMPALQGKELGDRNVYAQLLPYPNWPEEQHVLIAGDLKMLYHRSRNLWMLFDLKNDPSERKNLMRSHAQSAQLQHLMRGIIQARSR